MTENREKTVAAIEALPDEMMDKEIAALLMTICTTYGVSPEKVSMIGAAMIESVVTGEYEAVLERALAEEEEGNEEDEG